MYSEKKIGHIILVVLILIFSATQYFIVSPLQSLPSPIYGGDYYYQLSGTNHVKYGGNPLVSPNVNGALPVYFVLYSTITGYIAKLFGLEAITTEFVFSYFIIIFSIIIIFFLSNRLFNNNLISMFTVLAFVSLGSVPIIKYTELAYFVMVPLFVLTLYNFIKNGSIRNGIILGLVYGLVGLTHSVAFMAISLLMLPVFLYYGIYRLIFKEQNLFEKGIIDKVKLKKQIFAFFVVFLVAIPIAMLWWYEPVFIYHAQTSPHYSEWNNQDWSVFSNQIDFLVDALIEVFFNFSSISTSIISIFTLIGLASFFLIKNKSEEIVFVQFLICSSLLVTFHYFVTQNLADINFIPLYMKYLLLRFAATLVFSLGVFFVYRLVEKSSFASNRRYVKYVLATIMLIFMILNQTNLIAEKLNDRWFTVGKSPLPEQLVSLERYLTSNSDVYDTILTTKEVGFALTALTGRKLVVSRRAHNDPFLDMDPRELDAAIILYGNNSDVKRGLLEKYNITYLYWDYYWVQSEYYFDENGKVTGWFDPLILFDSSEKRQILDENKVEYFVQNTWVDPALKGDVYKKFDIIFISPANYYNITHPWSPDLDSYLTEVWNFSSNNQVIARLYKVEQ